MMAMSDGNRLWRWAAAIGDSEVDDYLVDNHHEQSGLGRPFGNLDSQGIEECSDDAELIVFKENNAAPTSLPDQKRF